MSSKVGFRPIYEDLHIKGKYRRGRPGDEIIISIQKRKCYRSWLTCGVGIKEREEWMHGLGNVYFWR
jgi:hypothetical protein